MPVYRKHQSKVKLDNPFRTLGAATNVSKEDSVFRNPFRDKEEKKIAVLEHHVKVALTVLRLLKYLKHRFNQQNHLTFTL